MAQILVAFHKLGHDYSDVPSILEELPLRDLKKIVNHGTYIIDTDQTAQQVFDSLKKVCHDAVMKKIDEKMKVHLATTKEPPDSTADIQLAKDADKTASNTYEIYVLPMAGLPH